MRKTNNQKLSATRDKNKQVLETLFSTPASGNGNELTLLELIERIVVSLKIDDNKDGKEQGATEVYEIELSSADSSTKSCSRNPTPLSAARYGRR